MSHRTYLLQAIAIAGAVLWGLVELVALLRSRWMHRTTH